MSTIAWDGRIGMLAADRQLTLGNSPLPVTKLFKLEKAAACILIACCGDYEDALRFAEWMADNKPGTITLQDNFSALVVDRGCCWRYGQQLRGYLIDAPFWAAGSGADYAVGAMAMGANAREAVEIASQYDVFTGCGVDVEVMPVAPRGDAGVRPVRPALHTADLTGRRFHWLKVLEGTDQGVAGNRLWLCECACGRKKLVKRKNLISGTTRSCGCLQRKVSSSRLGGSTWCLMPGAEA